MGSIKIRTLGFQVRGVDEGRRPELVGGGLIRSLDGWFSEKTMRRSGERKRGDDRILGRGEFVERVIDEADAKVRHQLPLLGHCQKIDEFIARM